MKIKSLFLVSIFSFALNIFSTEINNGEKEERIPIYKGSVSIGSPKIYIDRNTKKLTILTKVTIAPGYMNQIKEFRRKKALLNDKDYKTLLSRDATLKGTAVFVPLCLDLFKNHKGSFKNPYDVNSTIECKIEPIKAIFRLILDYTFEKNALQNLYDEYLQQAFGEKNYCTIQ